MYFAGRGGGGRGGGRNQQFTSRTATATKGKNDFDDDSDDVRSIDLATSVGPFGSVLAPELGGGEAGSAGRRRSWKNLDFYDIVGGERSGRVECIVRGKGKISSLTRKHRPRVTFSGETFYASLPLSSSL